MFRLQFDEFQIVSSSHDDTILIWDFFNNSAVSLPQPQARAQSRIADVDKVSSSSAAGPVGSTDSGV